MTVPLKVAPFRSSSTVAIVISEGSWPDISAINFFLGEFSTIENDFTRALWAIAKLSGRISASVLQMYSQAKYRTKIVEHWGIHPFSVPSWEQCFGDGQVHNSFGIFLSWARIKIKMPYSSSLSDKEWEIIEPLLPKKKLSPDSQMDKAPNSRVECSISWRMAAIGETCPQTCHRTRAVFWHYKNWRSEGVLDEIMTALHAQVRQRAQKNSNGHDCWSLTSLAVKNTCTASIETKGFCFYKFTNGREFWGR